MGSVIFCPTVMSTGTHFVLDFFKLNPDVPINIGLRTILKTGHLRPGINLVHTHFEWHADRMHEIIEFSPSAHTVVPIRDPLASLIKARERTSYKYYAPARINAFLNAVSLEKHRKIHYIPVDLLGNMSYEIKLEALKVISGGWVKEDLQKTWASDWPVVHTAGNYRLKQMYNDGDFNAISKVLPSDWLKSLIEARPILKPFLQQLGYKDLMWW